jgi:hypothetical protein
MAYIGLEPGSRSVRTVTKHVATANQSVFNVSGGYTKGFVDVYKQGLKLSDGTDYTATDNLTVVLSANATVSDKIDIISYSPLAIYSVVSKAGDAMTGDLTVPNISSTANVIGTNGYFTHLKVDANTVVNSSLVITGNTVQTGDLNLTGNLNLSGSLSITGEATSVTTQSLSVEDSIIIMASNNSLDTLDIGFAGRYNNGSANVYAGMVRNATDKEFYVFVEYDTIPGNDIDLSDPSFKIANLHANFNGNLTSNSVSVVSLNATNGTFTSSITLTGDASGYRQESTSIYGGDAGVGYGRIEYHSDKWILNAGSDSSNTVVFRRGNEDKSWIDNSGRFTGPLSISGTVIANGSVGTSGQVLTSNTTGVYWSDPSGGSGTPTGSNTDIQFNDSGAFGGVANLTFDKSTSIVSVGNSSVNTKIAANGIILAGDSGLVPLSNSVGTALGQSDKRFVISANTADFTGTVTGTVANMSTSVNSALLTVGSSLIANTTGVYHTGTVNAASHTVGSSLIANATGVYHTGTVNAASFTTTGLVANTTAVAPTSNTILLGNSTGRFVLSANTGDFTGTVTGTVANMSTSVNSAQLTVGSSFIANTTGAYHTGTVNASSLTTTGVVINATAVTPTSNAILLGNSTGRFVLSANTGDFTGDVTGTTANMSTSVNSALLTVGSSFIANTTGAYHTGVVNAASYAAGTINSTSNGFFANSTAISVGNTLVNVSISVSGITTSGNVISSGGVFPSSNTVQLGNSTAQWVLSANTGSFTGAITSSGGVNPASNSVGTSLGSSTARWILNANSGNFTANIAMNSNYVTGLSDPVNAQDAATKAYVDTFQQGLHIHDSCDCATEDTLADLINDISGVTYNNGTSGVGATLTLSTALTQIDGHVLTNGDRILVKNEATAAHNGIYERTSSTVLTRATDFDSGVEIAGGDFTFITNGTLYNSTGWVQADEVTTVGTDPITFTQFSGAGTFTAGQYLYLSGSQFNVDASPINLPSVVVARDSFGSFDANTAWLANVNSNTNANLNQVQVANLTVSDTITFDNNKQIGFKTLSGDKVRLIHQNDDKTVLYTTNTAGGDRAVFSLFANSTTSNLQIHTPLEPLGKVVANGSSGSSGDVLYSNGTATYWAAPSGGGTPGGSNTTIQYNDSGSFGGSGGFTFDESSNNVTVANTFTAPIITTGASKFLANTTLVQFPFSFQANDSAVLMQTFMVANSSGFNVGANVNLTTTTIKVGNSTINSVVNSTSFALGKQVSGNSNTVYQVYNESTNSLDTVFV